MFKAKKKKKIALPSIKQVDSVTTPIGKNIYLSQSAIQRFLTCRKKARLVRDGWYAKKSFRALRYGHMFHAVLESVTRASMLVPKSITDDIVAAEVKTYLSRWEEENQNLVNNAEIAQEMLVDAALVRVAVQEYVRFHREDFDGTKKWVALESKFEVPYHGVVLYGYIDAVYEQKQQHHIFETKTKGMVSSELVDLLHVDFQSFYYIHAYNLATGIFPKALVYNIARKFGGKPKVNEGVEEFAARFRADLKLRPEYYFVRVQTLIKPQDYKDWVKLNLDPLIEDYKGWLNGTSPDYCNTTSCEGKYGTCEFLPICSTGECDPTKFGQRTADERRRESSRQQPSVAAAPQGV